MRVPHRAAWLGLMLCIVTLGAARAQEALDCLIDSHSRVKVSAASVGVISKVHVDRGDVVHAGEVLVELESSVEAAQLAAARARANNDQPIASATARLDLARKVLDRLARLRKASPGAVTEVKYDEAATEVASATANLRDAEQNRELARLEAERAQATLALRRVVSPIDGVVVERALTAGEYRTEQAHVLTLARIDPLHVEVFAPLRLFGTLTLGQAAKIVPEAPVGGEYEARITVIDRTIDAASGTFGVRLALPNPSLSIPAGLRCQVRFEPAPG
jgi:RND family efflux transporter MFP subunit